MPIVYQITCISTGKIYIGWTTKTLASRFRKHCRNIKRDSYLYRCIQKYGAQNFDAVVLFEFETAEEAIAKEVELIAALKLNVSRFPDGNGMNMTDGGEGSAGYRHNEKAKEAIRVSSCGRSHSEATRKLISSNSRKIRYVRTPAHKAKISEGLKAAYASDLRRPSKHRHSDETKRKMSLAKQGKLKSSETRRRMSLAQRGKLLTESTKQRLREINTGKKQSPETVEKRVSKLRGRKQPPRSPELKARLAAILRDATAKNGPAFQGKKHSEESRAKMRASRMAYIEKKKREDDEP